MVSSPWHKNSTYFQVVKNTKFVEFAMLEIMKCAVKAC